MYTGFSAAMVRPQGTESQVPMEIVPPFTIFNACRKNNGGFSRASTPWLYTAPGQLVARLLHPEAEVFESIAGCGDVGKRFALDAFRRMPVPAVLESGSGAVI